MLHSPKWFGSPKSNQTDPTEVWTSKQEELLIFPKEMKQERAASIKKNKLNTTAQLLI